MTASATNADIDVSPLSTLSGMLTKHIQHQPNRTALGTSDLGMVITYRQLDVLVRSVMEQLLRYGLRRGDAVALVSDSSVEFVVGLLAVVSFGARVAPLNPSLTSMELNTRLSQLSANALLIPRHLANRLESSISVSNDISLLIMDLERSLSSFKATVTEPNQRLRALGAADEPSASIDCEDVALLMFTGGTTGTPKLVPLTHRNIAASIENISSVYALSPDDVTLVVMPLFHVHGLIAGLLATLASGGSAYLPSTGAFSAHQFWPDVLRLGVTWYTAVPTIHRILLNRAHKEYPVSSPAGLRFIRSCSAPLDVELAAATSATFRAPVISAYGMTEAAHQVASSPLPSRGSSKGSSVGWPTGVEIRIVTDGGQEAATDGIGEIWIRGVSVTAGYIHNPEANSASFVDGWFRTGDLGSIDDEGYLFVRGRMKEMINRGGEKISPNDIDAALLSNPKVLEAASFGGPDTIYGENVQAAVILRPGVEATESELRDDCRGKLAAFEVPERIYIVADLPRTAKGSLDRHAIAIHFTETKLAGTEVLSTLPAHK